jgi:RES domain
VAPGERFGRIYLDRYPDPLGFGKTPSRFSDPRRRVGSSRFGVLYLGDTLKVCFLEAVLRATSGMASLATCPLPRRKFDVVTPRSKRSCRFDLGVSGTTMPLSWAFLQTCIGRAGKHWRAPGRWRSMTISAAIVTIRRKPRDVPMPIWRRGARRRRGCVRCRHLPDRTGRPCQRIMS